MAPKATQEIPSKHKWKRLARTKNKQSTGVIIEELKEGKIHSESNEKRKYIEKDESNNKNVALLFQKLKGWRKLAPTGPTLINEDTSLELSWCGESPNNLQSKRNF